MHSHKSKDGLRPIRIHPTGHSILSAVADSYRLRMADLVEALAYGLEAEAVVLPNHSQFLPWKGYRVLLQPNGDPYLQTFQAESLQEVGKGLGIFCCKGGTRAA